jgi:hypothetical protein
MQARLRLVRVASTWLTAVMVVIGGTPQLACVCSFCDAAPASAETTPLSCCCSSSEPTASADQDGVRRTKSCCCCSADDEPAVKPAETDRQIKAPLCLKKPAPREVFVPAQRQVEAQPDCTALTFIISAARPMFASKRDCLSSNDSLAPPPTDLIIALQHFLI